jgi:hypothetical protein
MELKISTMTGKMQNIPAINTNTLTNPFCIRTSKSDSPDSICGKCYSVKMLSTYRANCVPPFERNSLLLSDALIPDDELPVINAHSFRFHGHGELINSTHYLNFVRIARKNPGCTFALWTKRRDIIRAGDARIDGCYYPRRPDNLVLVYSNPRIDKVMHKPPVGFDKVFNNTSSLTESDNCSGRKCIECLQCYRHDSGVDVIIEKVK